MLMLLTQAVTEDFTTRRVILSFVPWVLLAVLVWGLYRGRKREMEQVQIELDRNQAHRDAVEQKLNHIIQLLQKHN